MSTTTATFGLDTATQADAKPRKTFFERMIEARTRQGEARVRATLARMSDAHLADIGFTPDQVRQVRDSGKVPLSFWA